MKTLLPLLMSFGIISPLMAVEYVTLHKPGDSKTVSSGSLVEVIGYGDSGYSSFSTQPMVVTYADGTTENQYLAKVLNVGSSSTVNPYKVKYTGITKVQLSNDYFFSVTFKITPPAEINAVGPTSVLVIPENSTGDYDIILESSTDMVTWTPIHSQSVSSSNPTNLFRTRIVKKTAP